MEIIMHLYIAIRFYICIIISNATHINTGERDGIRRFNTSRTTNN
jgi:hypothetical protein